MSIISKIPFESFFRKHDDVMLFMHGETGQLIDANDAALRFYGYSLEQITTMKIDDINKLSPEELDAECQTALEEKRKYFVVPHRLADGEIRTVEVHTTPVAIDTVKYLLSIIHDITDRKQTETALVASADNFRAIAATTPDHILMQDRELRYMFVLNPQLGLTEAEMIGKTDSDFLEAADAAKLTTIKQSVLQTGKPYHLKTSLINKAGTIEYFEGSYLPKFNDKGDVDGLIGYFRNVTDRMNAEEALRHSEQKFYLAFHSSPSMYAITTVAEGRFVEVNESFLRFAGYTREEVIGHTVFELNLWADAEQAKSLRIQLQEKGCVRNFESTYRSKSGRIGYGLISATFIDIGEKPCLLTETVDITERKCTEESLRNMQKLESLGILAGGIAHDFNNLMGGIFGYIDIALEKCENPAVANYLLKTVNTIDRARALTQQLLTFAKGGSPVQKIEPLFPFVQETTAFALSGSNTTCRYNVQENLWVCNYDRNQIGQVIDNIVINAQQAMPVGGTIELSARNITLSENEHPILAQGNYVKISVKDVGIGIPKDLLSKIFDPFFTTKSKGHGLGLATCYSVISRHGGSIDVESEPGKGSTFFIYLPAAPDAVPDGTRECESLHKGSGTFLVMDDEVVMQETIHDMLVSFGYTVVCRENGKDAVDFITAETSNNRKIAGAIFDLTIPGGMGGIAAIKEIRKTDKELSVFVASGYAEDPVMKNPFEFGFTASICKPFRKRELSEILNKYLNLPK